MKIDDIDAFVAVIPQRSPEPGRREHGPDPVCDHPAGTEPGGVPRVALLDRKYQAAQTHRQRTAGLRTVPAGLREVDGLRELVAGDATPSGRAAPGACRRVSARWCCWMPFGGRPTSTRSCARRSALAGGSHLLARLENAELDAAVGVVSAKQGVPRRTRRHAPRAHGTLRGGRLTTVPSRRDARSIATTMAGCSTPMAAASVPARNGPWPIRAWACNLNLETFGSEPHWPGRRGSGLG